MHGRNKTEDIGPLITKKRKNEMIKDAKPGKDGNKYVPFSERTGEKSVVFFTRDLSAEGLKKIFDRVSKGLEGKIAIKLHTGEAEGPNIIPSSLGKRAL